MDELNKAYLQQLISVLTPEEVIWVLENLTGTPTRDEQDIALAAFAEFKTEFTLWSEVYRGRLQLFVAGNKLAFALPPEQEDFDFPGFSLN